MMGLIYPCVANWTWGGGWLSAGNIKNSVGFYDFAGSGIVHLTGGTAALIISIILGARKGKFMKKNEEEKDIKSIEINELGDLSKVRKSLNMKNEDAMEGHSNTNMALGTLILWLGWLFFNAGSTSDIVGLAFSQTEARAMANSIICPAAAGLTAVFLKGFITGNKSISWDITALCNGILAGLVTVSAGCDNMHPWMSLIVGFFGAIMYCLGCRMMNKLEIDDPTEAFPIHGMCGMWGLIVVAFCHKSVGVFYGHSLEILGW